MRIAITADPYIPVPPVEYGGIERVIDFLIRGLVDRGHEVTLFAHPDSSTPAPLIPYGVPPHWGAGPRLRELWQVGAGLLRRASGFDLVHSFGRLAALLPVLPLRRLAKIQSYQRPAIPWRSIELASMLAGNSIEFTTCARWMFRDRKRYGRYGGEWNAIFNGVALEKFTFVERVPDDAPLVFLGRLEKIKGAHHAIAIARASGRRLMLAGNQVREGADAGYFEREIAPHLDENITYIGPVDDVRKNQLLGGAAAFLMPIEWEEPFGIVMAEALACGTPVIGFNLGSVPEVVRDGVNGFVCADVPTAAEGVRRLGSIDRRGVRADCEARFSSTVLVDQYEALYGRILERLK